MNYKNAKIILPAALLAEVQKYVNGEFIYIPAKPDYRASWGQKNGARQRYNTRNQEIIKLYDSGFSIKDLSKKFFLSTDSIKKIIKKES